MRLALIPPLAYLDQTHQTDMQLMLPELLQDYDYYTVMEGHLSNPNQYVILDNGAAEARQPAFDELMAIVEDLYPQELAIPDVLRNGPASIAKAESFLKTYGSYFLTLPTKLGIVAAGANMFDAGKTVSFVMRRYAEYVDVIYIPRSLLADSQDPLARIKLANSFHKFWPDKEIHLFGASTYRANEVQFASKLPYIRSIDTSLPYSSAAMNMSLRNSNGSGRPDHYFDLVFDTEQQAYMYDNVAQYREWIDE
jgi:hypothetical protein